MQQLGERERGLWALGGAGGFAGRRTCAGQAQVKDNVGVAGKNAQLQQLHTQQEDRSLSCPGGPELRTKLPSPALRRRLSNSYAHASMSPPPDHDDEQPSYIDYEAFLDPAFSPTAFANTLVLATNNASDTPLDLSTPLSRLLFDVQEVDTHIDTLTTKAATPLLDHTRDHAAASGRVLHQLQSQIASLTESYRALQKEVIERHAVADQVRLVAERLCEAVKLGRAVARCLMLGRQLEVRMSELGGIGSAKKEDHRAMVRSADTVLSLRQILSASKPGEEGEGLDRVYIINTLKNELVNPGERSIASRAQQVVKEFAISPSQNTTSTFAQTEDVKAKTTSALVTLFLLSPIQDPFEPTLMQNAVQDYLQTQVKAALTPLARSLGQLPTLDRTLLDIYARCQNIIVLQALLEATALPRHALLDSSSTGPTQRTSTLLQPVLHALDTSLLLSYFWRSLAQNLSPRVQELMQRGGVSARTLRSNKDRVRDMVRECVNTSSSKGSASLEREAAVMVGSIVGQIR